MPIQNEEEFSKAKESVNTDMPNFRSERFSELEKYIREALKKQDSDAALTLITKGSLSFG